MKYGEGWNKIDHFTSFNTVQKQPQQPEGWKLFLPLTSQQLLLLSSWRGSCHATGISAPPSEPSLLHPAGSMQQRRAYSDPGDPEDPECDEYHTHQQTTNQPARTRPSPMDKQSLSLNQVKAKLQTQRANQFSSSQVDGMGEGGVIKFRRS